jgi:hypothetical protein
MRTCWAVQLRHCRDTDRRWPFPLRPFERAAFGLADLGLGILGPASFGLSPGDAVGGASVFASVPAGISADASAGACANIIACAAAGSGAGDGASCLIQRA